MKETSQRLPSLDGLRAVAVLMVVFTHAGETWGAPDSRIYKELSLFFSGYLGVQVFFVISGFIITRLLMQEKVQRGHVSLRRFWARRFLRIVPPLALYLSVISVMNAQGLLQVSALSQWGSLLFFRNHLPMEMDSFNAHYWSLSVEEQFYLLWPLLIAFAMFFNIRRGAWMVMAVALVARITFFLMGESEPRWLIIHADCLMAGALAAMWLQDQGLQAVKPLTTKEKLLHLGVFVFCLLVTRICATRYSAYFAPFQPTLISIFMALWIVRLVSVREGWLFQILNQRFVIWLGMISYSTYIWQQLFTTGVMDWPGAAPWFSHFPLNVLLSILAGALSFAFIERPLQRLRHRWDSLLGYGSNVVTGNTKASGSIR